MHYVDHFAEFLLPDDEQQVGRTPKVFVDDGDWREVCKGLIDRGLCSVFKENEIHQIGGRCLLNGMFAVSNRSL